MNLNLTSMLFKADPTLEEFPSLENLALSPTPSTSPKMPVNVQFEELTLNKSFLFKSISVVRCRKI